MSALRTPVQLVKGFENDLPLCTPIHSTPKSPITGKATQNGRSLDHVPHLPAARQVWEAKALRFTAVVSIFYYFRPEHGKSEDQLPQGQCLRKDLATSQAVQRGAECVCRRTVISKAKATSEAKAPTNP